LLLFDFFVLALRSWQLTFMTLVGEMPPWMQRHFAVYAARSSHNFCAKQIRKKLIVETSADALLAEAFAMVNRDIGTFPSEENPANSPFPDDEDESTERDTRDIAMRNYDSLSEIETYMWGLGIAGVFPQWERGTRDVIATLARKPPPPEKLENMHFGELCKQVKKTGFDIELHRAFSGLRLACLIANTIKHGGGKSFRDLAAERPDLFQDTALGIPVATAPAQPHHLRVSASQFDEAVDAIDEIWGEYEGVASKA
jgi:hypothetical protein